jgi:hypothetical protein
VNKYKRQSLQKGQLTGSSQFVDEKEKKIKSPFRHDAARSVDGSKDQDEHFYRSPKKAA